MRSTASLRPPVLRPALTAILGLAMLALVPAPASAAPAHELRPGDVAVTVAEPLLEKPLNGRPAIRELGDRLEVAAARNDLAPADLRALLRTDPSAWLDQQGDIFYIDPAHDDVDQELDSGSPARRAQTAPLSETFQLHSNPTANRTILLDFDGAAVSGSSWNTQAGVASATHPAWDPAANGPTFTDAERRLVQEIWAIVAEDYAPFEVDVTTEDLGADRIVRSSSADMVYGTRVLVTPSDDPFLKICNRQCGGVAYLGVFDRVGSTAQPAWVFPQALGNDPKSVAEAATHEAGHNLGLDHDGTAGLDYYTGHGVWAPIMGVGYERPLVQWSAGSYTGANNGQDDLAIITGYLGARQDEAGGSAAAPAALPTGEAVIGTSADVDAFVLGACTAGATVSVAPSAIAPNLDVRAALVDSAGVERTVSAPPSGFGDGSTATGLGASLTVPDATAGWVLTVEGVGQGSWASSGYDDYASLGAYTVDAPGCDGALDAGVPSEPTGVTSSVGGTASLTLAWGAPAAPGDGPVAGYVVSRSGSATSVQLGPDARSHTFTGLAAATTYELSVRAVNATGAGRTTTVSARTADPDPVPPGSPRDLVGNYLPGTGQIEAFWTEPASTGTAPISGYDIFVDGGYLGRLGSTSRGVTVTRTNGFPAGQYVVGVAAVSSAGSSPASTVTVVVGPVDRPVNDDVAAATVLLGPSGSVAGDNATASAEVTDPTPPSTFAAGGYSVWYSWTPSQGGQVELQTSGGAAGRDTTLAAYTGQPGSLTEVAGADDSIGAHAAISFTAVAGTRYLVAVDGFSFTGGSGPFTLTWSQTTAPPPSVPSAPTQVTAQGGNSSATVSWTAPGSNGSPITGYTVTSTPGGITRTVPATTTSTTVGGLTNGTAYAFSVVATNAIGDSPPSQASNQVTPTAPDITGPVVSQFDFTPKTVELRDGSKDVTISVRITDATGVEAPFMIIDSDTTEQTLGFGQLNRTSGTAQDGTYQRTVTIPTTAAPGTWSVTLYPVRDTLGNQGPGFQDHPSNLTITNTPQDTAGPVVTNFDFTPKTVELRDGSKDVTISVRITDATGVEAPFMIIDSDTTEQTLGFGQLNRTSGTAQDGTYQRTVTIPTTAAPGTWTVTLYPVRDTLGNQGPGFQDHPSKLTITNTPPATAPPAPTAVTATAGDAQATVTWTKPTTDGGSPITGYTVTATPGGATRTVTGPDTTTATITGLTNGTTYTFTVTATNTNGDSPASSASNAVTPLAPDTAPPAPTAVTATAGDAQATVTWTKPTTNGGSPITSYTVTATPGGATRTVTGPDTTTATITGLTNGTTYTFTVTATNTIGDSPTSQASSQVTPAGAPGRIKPPNVVVKGSKAIVRWVAADANGAPIVRYLVDISKGKDQALSAGARTTVFKRLKPGRYKVRVAGSNASGTGLYSAWATFRIR